MRQEIILMIWIIFLKHNYSEKTLLKNEMAQPCIKTVPEAGTVLIHFFIENQSSIPYNDRCSFIH